MNIRIEKRIPFGFNGLWGKCYKQTTFDKPTNQINYQGGTYFEIGQDVQFKFLDDNFKDIFKLIKNVLDDKEFKYIETTDAFFNYKTRQYECIVKPADIVFFLDTFWTCEEVKERPVFNPNKQSFYYLKLKQIDDGMITIGVK